MVAPVTKAYWSAGESPAQSARLGSANSLSVGSAVVLNLECLFVFKSLNHVTF
jgi:hypothetical protein